MDTYQQDESPVRAIAAAIAISLGAILATQLTTLPVLLTDPTVATAPADADRSAAVALLALNFVGFFLAGAFYLHLTDRGLAYIDFRLPTARDWKYVIGGAIGSIAFIIVASLLLSLLEMPTTENEVMAYIGGDPNMVLVLIGIVILFNAPAEEFLFRNVIQKRLYEAFSRTHAILVTSIIFALFHLPAYGLSPGGIPPLEAVAASLTVVFLGSVIFGYLYAKTDNLVVPIAAHAAFNAFQFGLLYIALRFGDGEATELAQTLVWCLG